MIHSRCDLNMRMRNQRLFVKRTNYVVVVLTLSHFYHIQGRRTYLLLPLPLPPHLRRRHPASSAVICHVIQAARSPLLVCRNRSQIRL